MKWPFCVCVCVSRPDFNANSLRWRHNGPDIVSNHQPHYCLLNRLFRRRSKETSKLRVTGLCAGNSPGTGEFSAQMASYAENVSIWWRHHVMCFQYKGPYPVMHKYVRIFNFIKTFVLCSRLCICMSRMRSCTALHTLPSIENWLYCFARYSLSDCWVKLPVVCNRRQMHIFKQIPFLCFFPAKSDGFICLLMLVLLYFLCNFHPYICI